MDRQSRVVIIGAGIVGSSLADNLTRLGCTDVLVLDQGPLFSTGGSTFHAPGGVFQTNFSRTMTQFAQATVQRYSELDLDGQPCFLGVGSIEFAATAERWEDLKRKHGAATAWGVESHLIDPDECAARVPILDPARVYGGLYVPTDGIAKAARAVEAMALLATGRGARFQGNTEVTGITVEGGRVRSVETPAGSIDADVVVSCAGIWGPRIARMAGVPMPLVPMEHQYIETDVVDALRGETEEVSHPVLRHQDRAMYFRQHGDRYGVGSYQHTPLPISADALLPVGEAEVMPSVVRFTAEDFDPAWHDAVDLMPALAGSKFVRAINGIFSFTADGFPLIGESRRVSGFWMAEAVWITHAVGVARSTAEWMVEGVSQIDLRQCDIERFEPYALSPTYVMERSIVSYDEVYDIKHPLEPIETPRPMRTSPFYERERVLGAVFFEASGWERPQWYESNAPLLDGLTVPARGEWEGRFWSPIAAAEHVATRERVGLYDMNSLTKVIVSGPGALPLLQSLTTSNMDRSVGSVTYTLMLDEVGGIKSDLTVARLGPDRFQLGCNGPRDVDWLLRHAPDDGSAHVEELTGGLCCLGLWGPRARDVVQAVSDDDFSETGLRYFRAREAYIGTVRVTAMRVSYVGELGWELYTTADSGPALWDTLWRAGEPIGLVPGGRAAFDSLRVEKGYRFYGRDMWTEHDPFEAGIGFAVNLDKPEFVGREALLRRKAEGPRHVLTCLTLDDPSRVVMGGEPVYDGDAPVGYVTSAAYGYSIGRGIAYAWLDPRCAPPGTNLQIEYFGERLPATVQTEPLFDPGMERLRPPRVRRAPVGA
jgi:glycine cleavage system aminomethyltransferase T/glycine/D-amino acid oxidase-like deaminating enzyme